MLTLLQKQLNENIWQTVDNKKPTFPSIFQVLVKMYADTNVKVREVYQAALDIKELIEEYHGDIQIMTTIPGFDVSVLNKMKNKERLLWRAIVGRLNEIG